MNKLIRLVVESECWLWTHWIAGHPLLVSERQLRHQTACTKWHDSLPSLSSHSLCSRISRSPPVILAIGGRLAILDAGLVRCPSPSPAPNWKPASLAHHTAAPTGGISTVVSGARRDCGTFRCIAITTTRGVRALHFAEPPVFREEVDVGVKWAWTV